MFLLCSDGLSNEVEDAGIAEVLAASGGDWRGGGQRAGAARAGERRARQRIGRRAAREDIGGGSGHDAAQPGG